MALLVRGFKTWVYSREAASSERAAWVEKVGAQYICSSDLPVGDLQKRVGNVDLIYEATGSANLAFAAMPAIGVNGIFIFTGVPGHKTEVTLDGQKIMRDLVLENQVLYGTVNAGPPAFDPPSPTWRSSRRAGRSRSGRSSPVTTRPRRSPRCWPASRGRSRP